MNDIVTTGRSADTIATEIRVITTQAQQMLTWAVIKIGQNLHEAKALVPHGEWGAYVEERCGFSQRTANNYMKLAEEFGNSQSIANLPYSKALALLALPADEREGFAEENRVEALSVAELKRRIAAEQSRAAKAEEDVTAQKKLLLLATEENGALKQRLDGIDADYKAQLEGVDKENDVLRAKLKAASKPAEISAENAEQLREEGRKTAEEKFQQSLLQLTEETKAELEGKDKRIAELEAQLAAAAQPAPAPVIAQGDADTIKLLFEEIGGRFNVLNGMRIKAAARAQKVAQLILAMTKQQILVVAKAFGLEVSV